MKAKAKKVNVPMTWDRFSEVIQKAVLDGNRAEVVLRDKKNKTYLRASFRLKPPSPSEVRIPCIVVPPSPFQVLRGIAPGFTGGKSSTQWVRDRRRALERDSRRRTP